MLGNNWNKQELFPSYQYTPVPNTIIASQFASRRNSTPKYYEVNNHPLEGTKHLLPSQSLAFVTPAVAESVAYLASETIRSTQ